MEKIVIIGGVAAGATAAAKARRISADAHITMIEAGADISFANCGLPYYIGGDIKSRSKLILQSPESFKEQYDVEVHTHTLVMSIRRDAKQVIALDSKSGQRRTFDYTKLILAQGGRPITPNLPGAQLDHVFTLWTLDDMDRISAHLENRAPKTAVVVGGGFIGLEMVEALAKRGLQVNVVETMPHVMSLMEGETAGFIEQELHAYGVGVHTRRSVTEIKAKSVVLDNGKEISADMVLLSVGVRPTLQLAQEAGLELGEAGGLLVDEYLRTSDPNIWAAGDMVEITHRVNGKKVRIPLAGPANRQGRIAAENALGASHAYKGALGTSIVRVFEAVAGITGLSLKQARAAGIDADAVVVHKEHHTSYYPNAQIVSVMLVFDKQTGVILGGQTAGYQGADKRLDVIATAAAAKLTVSDLAEVDFAYSPPIGTANDALNMAAYTAENKLSGFSNSITTTDLDVYAEMANPLIIDVRDYFAFEKNHIEGARHIPLELLAKELQTLPTERPILVYDETGKKGHQALRMLQGAGFKDLTNLSGGHISLQRHARTIGFTNIRVSLLPVESKTHQAETSKEQPAPVSQKAEVAETPLIVDVRTESEFRSGAYPGAINIPVDSLATRYTELGNNMSREITVYCASGARSAYAEMMLRQIGFTQVKNGGGITTMLSRSKAPTKTVTEEAPLVIDVRTPQEFRGGAFPKAVNIPLDELPKQLAKLGSKGRDITVYCASGARSSYAQNLLSQNGFTNVKNGGGIMQMMRRQR